MGTTHHRIGRRELLAGAVALAATAGATGRLQAQEQLATPSPATLLPAQLPGGGMQVDGTWSFTDDLGQTITAPAAPTRVAAHVDLAAALYDFGFEVAAYYNDAEDEDGAPLTITGNLPYKDLPSLGAYADVNFEKMVELGIDLFVAPTWDLASGYVWPFDDDTLTKIRDITPVAVIAFSDGADTRRTIEAIGSVAAALGADADAPAVQEARADFEAAAADLETALAAKPDLTTLFVSPDTDGFWLADNYSDITFFQKLGMRVLAATAGVTAAISWEQFPLWQADLIFMDDRWPDLDELAALVPVYTAHPAVEAGQVVPWRLLYVPSYQGFTPILREVTENVQAARGGVFG